MRAAEQRDFDVYLARDCTSAEQSAHERALAAMSPLFATVGTGAELVDRLVGA